MQAEGKIPLSSLFATVDFSAGQPAFPAKGELHFIAVEENLRRSGRWQNLGVFETAETMEHIDDLLVLFRKLFFILQVLQRTAAAIIKMLAPGWGLIR